MTDIFIFIFFTGFFLACLITLIVIGFYSLWANIKDLQDNRENDHRIFK